MDICADLKNPYNNFLYLFKGSFLYFIWLFFVFYLQIYNECPMAYKDMSDIVANIGPTAEIIKIIRPVYNFKDGEEEPSSKRKRR